MHVLNISIIIRQAASSRFSDVTAPTFTVSSNTSRDAAAAQFRETTAQFSVSSLIGRILLLFDLYTDQERISGAQTLLNIPHDNVHDTITTLALCTTRRVVNGVAQISEYTSLDSAHG
jgi:hypothetical protein